jgi:hypothetical protein
MKTFPMNENDEKLFSTFFPLFFSARYSSSVRKRKKEESLAL